MSRKIFNAYINIAFQKLSAQNFRIAQVSSVALAFPCEPWFHWKLWRFFCLNWPKPGLGLLLTSEIEFFLIIALLTLYSVGQWYLVPSYEFLVLCVSLFIEDSKLIKANLAKDVSSWYNGNLHPRNSLLTWWGGFQTKNFHEVSTRRARQSDAATFHKHKQIALMPMPRTWFQIEQFRLE